MFNRPSILKHQTQNETYGSLKQFHGIAKRFARFSILVHFIHFIPKQNLTLIVIIKQKQHGVKSVQIWSFFWSVFSRIWTEYGPEKTPYLDTFQAVQGFYSKRSLNRLVILQKPGKQGKHKYLKSVQSGVADFTYFLL